MTPELLRKYDRRVPRYTSYPTAPHFTAAISAETQAEWLAALPRDEAVSLYMHVPYCAELCWYCGCNTGVARRYAPVGDYVGALLAEIDLVAETIGRAATVGQLHFGGGTPNILSEADVARLIGAVHRRFAVSAGAEIAAECDPRTLTPEWLRAAAGLGLDRVSLGVQDLDPLVQQAINRWQPFEVTHRAFEAAKEAGIASVNVDLMYGLPHQTTEGVIATATRIAALRPDRVALFGYAHVPWMKAHQRMIATHALPDAYERLRQQDAAAGVLVAAGYVRIGLDHFALPTDGLAGAVTGGAVRRNFQGYTTDRSTSLVGLGASSISHFGQGYVQNAAKVAEWRAPIEAGRLAGVRGVALDDDDRFRAEVIQRLMCDLTVDLAEVCERHGMAVSTILPDLLDLCEAERDGLVTRVDGVVTVTEHGRPFLRTVAAAFDRYLERDALRHSAAV